MNSAGGDRPLTYIGSSQVVSPRGRVLVRLRRAGEGARVVSADLSEASDKRINRVNDLFRDHSPLYPKAPAQSGPAVPAA